MKKSVSVWVGILLFTLVKVSLAEEATEKVNFVAEKSPSEREGMNHEFDVSHSLC